VCSRAPQVDRPGTTRSASACSSESSTSPSDPPGYSRRYRDRDLQVPAEQSAPRAVELSGSPDATVLTLPGLNHLMQPADTGSPAEYARIDTTVATEVLDLVTGWLQERS
jgi:hypothetical protein